MTEGRSLRVVIVDDDADVRYLLRRTLHRYGGCTVVGEAADGAQGVAAAAEAQPDVVLLDIHLPDTDGITLLPAVREACPDAIVVVMSAHRTADVAERATERGALGFLPKQADHSRFVDDLLSLIADAVPAFDEDAVCWRLDAELTSGARARAQLRELLAEWELSELLDEAELLTTELVNNAVVHACSAVMLTVKRRLNALRVEVTDTGQGVLRRPDADLDDTHGRGLMLVEAMSSDWGTAMNGDVKTVWFEVATSSAPAGA